MTPALKFTANSDIGLLRDNNQDSAYAGPHLLAIADGMGGHAGGDVASSIAIASLAPLDIESYPPEKALYYLENAIGQAGDQIKENIAQYPFLKGMGTTVTAILRAGDKLAMAHLGDSRAYVLSGNKLYRVTTDHTYVQHLVDEGKISPDEALIHPKKNIVMRVLGDFDIDMTPDISLRDAKIGDRWMLCTDGLYGVLSHDTIQSILSSYEDIDECSEKLIELALRAGSTDNITVVIADVVDMDDPNTMPPSTVSVVVGSSAVDGDKMSIADLKDSNLPAAKAKKIAEKTKKNVEKTKKAAIAKAKEKGDKKSNKNKSKKKMSLTKKIILILSAVIIVVGSVGGYFAYSWAKEQYYIGINGQNVAIYKGISTSIFGLQLSEVYETTDIKTDDLSNARYTQIKNTIYVGSEQAAEEKISQIRSEVKKDSKSSKKSESTEKSESTKKSAAGDNVSAGEEENAEGAVSGAGDNISAAGAVLDTGDNISADGAVLDAGDNISAEGAVLDAEAVAMSGPHYNVYERSNA